MSLFGYILPGNRRYQHTYNSLSATSSLAVPFTLSADWFFIRLAGRLAACTVSEGHVPQFGIFTLRELNQSGANDGRSYSLVFLPLGCVPLLQQTIRVLVADDHAIFRDGLRKLLNSDDNITIVGEAHNGTECIKQLSKLKPDVLLLDLRMPDKDGLAVLKEVNFDNLPTRVVVLTAAEDDSDVVRAMRLGARGIVLKQSATDLLVQSIHRVHAGEIWLDDRMTAELMKAFSHSSESGLRSERPLLTDREKEIVQHVAQGFRNKEIAEKLFISEQTVKNHLHNIFDKLGVSDRLELALYAVHHRLIDQS
jgi:two-component system, NarL family, nitrate/nitrite response regulator NarL